MVKEYQDEYFSRQALILDSFTTPERVEDFESAVAIAASFVEPLQSSDNLLDLMFVADRAYTFTGGRGLLSSEAMLEILACVEASSEDFSKLDSAVRQHASALSACVCVFLTWDQPRYNLVNYLHTLGIPVRILVIGNSAAKVQISILPNLHFLDPEHLELGLANLA